MPRLSPGQMKFLNDNLKPQTTSFYEIALKDYDKDSVACWKWALFGLANKIKYNEDEDDSLIHRPGEFFNAISFGKDIHPHSFWYQYAKEAKEYNLIAAPVINGQKKPSREFATWRTGIMKNACEATCKWMELFDNSQPYDYTLVMYYADTTDKGFPNGPNETHWWIEIPLAGKNFVCIETFPAKENPPTLQFRVNARYKNDNLIRVPISTLLQQHLDLIPSA